MTAKDTARRFHAAVEVGVNEKTISIMLCLIELQIIQLFKWDICN